MPRARNKAETRRRIEAIRADRARGLTFSELAVRHGVSRSFAHWASRDVLVVYVWRRWHQARWNKPEPQAALPQTHLYRAAPWGST